ncbi:MAG: YraN family protein [Neomegalonema sp.]|nr:YraN family protein [Neomegalonema sp.]
MARKSAELWGRAAEEQVARWYQENGANLLGSRLRTPHGEIDLLFEDGHQLIFVEVKARGTLARAATAITPRSLERLLNAAEFLLAENGATGRDCRFDLAGVDRQGQVDVWENISLQ